MFTIDLRSRVPICEQLAASVRDRVIAGSLAPDAPLPSVRQLSAELGINPNTVQKAYAALERGGVIYSLPGRGSFVSGDTAALIAEKAAEASLELRALTKRAMSLGMDAGALYAIIEEEYRKGARADDTDR